MLPLLRSLTVESADSDPVEGKLLSVCSGSLTSIVSEPIDDQELFIMSSVVVVVVVRLSKLFRAKRLALEVFNWSEAKIRSMYELEKISRGSRRRRTWLQARKYGYIRTRSTCVSRCC